MSLEDYEFDHLDVAHVIAALSIVGSIVCSFDNNAPCEYFNQIDEASFEAAAALFPSVPKIRLFDRMSISEQGQVYWRLDEQLGMDMLLEQLPYAISWF